MASAECLYCKVSYVEAIKLNDDQIKEFFLEHDNFKAKRKCGNKNCDNILTVNESEWSFRCGKYNLVHKGKKKVKCRFVASALKGTFFENSKLSIAKIFYFVASVLCIPHPRQKFISENFGLPAKTVVDWYSFMREVFYDHVTERDGMLGGDGHVVEIDEAKFGKRKFNKGRRIEGQWVFGGIDRTTRQTFLIPVESRNKTLLSIIKEFIKPNTKIISDCWRSYKCLADEGFIHETVNHSKTFVNPINLAHTNTIERQWRNVKDTIPKYGRRKSHFVRYLAEYLFKAKYPTLNERIHYFWVAAAYLYPPAK